MRKHILQKVMALLAFGLLVYLGWRHAESIRWESIARAPHWALAALGFCFCTITLNFHVWYRLLNRNRQSLRLVDAYRLYSIASLSRYLPGGQLWQYASLLRFSKTVDGQADSMSAQFFATICGLSGGFLLLLLNLSEISLAGNGHALILSAAFLLIVMGLFSHPGSRASLSRVAARLSFNRYRKIPAISAPQFLTAILESAFSWSLTCLAYLSLATMAGEPFSVELLRYVMSGYAVAVLGAYVSLVTPAGLGVREGIFAALLSTKVSAGTAILVSLSGGITLFLAEVLFLTPFLLSHLLNVRRVSSSER